MSVIRTNPTQPAPHHTSIEPFDFVYHSAIIKMIRLNTAWLLLLLPLSSATDLTSFEDFVKNYGKVYESKEEEQIRRGIFEANLQEITKHNLEAQTGHLLKVNEFADRRIPEELPLGLHKKSKDGDFLMLNQQVCMKFYRYLFRRC